MKIGTSKSKAQKPKYLSFLLDFCLAFFVEVAGCVEDIAFFVEVVGCFEGIAFFVCVCEVKVLIYLINPPPPQKDDTKSIITRTMVLKIHLSLFLFLRVSPLIVSLCRG